MAVETSLAQPADALRRALPGVALAAAVAVAAYGGNRAIGTWVPIPAMVLALLIGIALNPVAAWPVCRPGLVFCGKVLLRWAVACLGLRVALADIASLGTAVAVLLIVAMAVTIVVGFALARAFGQPAGYGALAGAATAVCGASATLATATVVPHYQGKEADVAFVVVAVNSLATAGMLLYPLICVRLGFDPQMTGVMLGGTIHDVAQVVGAGYAVSEPVGNVAVIVKLFRVFLLLPVVLAIGWYFTRLGTAQRHARVPVPVFALVFLLLCLVNSAVPYVPVAAPVYAPAKAALGVFSTWGLLLAIAALGLDTSPAAVARLGWRHVATVIGTTVVILIFVTAGLFFL
ncbi:MAG: putative sulfate exporter family transporter [Hyphomicrobiales bacterium]|nr:putative sulfate exporter family transporter [Hyphomicrobiales bacterium]MBV8826917.1 putative sulfate exporter family transporter [Hyphomicrobiales bacterium]MBV9429501.1 putative sulfate exporter family transporter [Bradyrhizobiaceae bacterium]